MIKFIDVEDTGASLLTRLPNGEQGPAQGPYTPVNRYGDSYMPDGKEPGAPAPTPIRQVQQQLGTEVAQVAGIRPLPRARMARQAGRRKNEMFGSYGGGPMLFSRSRDATKRVKFSAEEVQTMLRSDPQFAASYQRQVVDGKRDEQTDKYDIRQWPDGSVTGYQYEPWTESDGSVRRQSIGKDAVKELTLERHRKNTQVVNEWDPIEASAQEDYNRLRGGNKNPLPDPGSVLIDLESIPTPSNPDGVKLFPGV